MSQVQRPFTRHIDRKIIFPYLILLCAIFVLGAHITIDLLTTTLEQKYREELAAAGRSANESMVLLEDRNLAVLRQMVFTEGVDTAVATGDTDSLQTLLAPVAANARLRYVDIFDAAGGEILALRANTSDQDFQSQLDANAGSWDPVKVALTGTTDEIGDKQASFVDSRWGRLFVTAGPIRQGDTVIGVIAVSVPIEDVTRRLSQDAGSKGITLYTLEGAPIASTIRASAQTLETALSVTAEQAQDARSGGQIVVRRSQIGDVPYVEALSVLAVRRHPVLLLGTGNLINIIDEQSSQTRPLLIALFIAAALIMVAVGIAIARRITRTVTPLVDATYRVQRNQLDFDVPVQSEDELGVLAVAFNEMRGGLLERLHAQNAIERYMSPKVYELIKTGELSMGGVSREITVVKTDIRDFTSLSETMQPEALVEFLNRYFDRIVGPITKYDGEVDKYMGDSVLAKFGATEWYADHARRAVLAMIEMLESCGALNGELRREGQAPIRMGIGANTGEAVVGNIGSAQRMEYTIISDAVNTAQRIEEMCKEIGWDLLISDRTYEQARDAIEVGEPWTINLRGQTRDTLVYPVLGRRGEVPPVRRAAYEAVATARGRAGRARP